MQYPTKRLPPLLVILCIFVAVFLCWPVPTPTLQQDKDNTAAPLYTNNNLVQHVAVSTSFIDGVDVKVQDAASLPGSTKITLTINRDNTPIKTVRTSLAKILSSDKLRFRFFPITTHPNETLSLELATPSLNQKKPLLVRSFHNTNELSFTVFSPEPQIFSLIHQILATNTIGTDIALTYAEGGNVLHGVNPYNRILQGNLQDNESYATYLPSFYLLSAASQWAGLQSYDSWIHFWRPVFLIFALATALILFSLFWRNGFYVLALFGAAFFLFNRWSLYIATVGLFDFIPIFFLVLSLALFKKRPFVALLVCGLSLSFRHIGAIIVPLYFIALWQSSPAGQKARRTLIGIVSLIAVPLTVSFPFLISNPTSFLKSMLFSFTRAPVTHFTVPSVDAFLGLIGPSAKIGLLILLAAVWYIYWRKYTGFFVSAFLSFMVFLDFHSIWFAQYMAYGAPLLILAILEVTQQSRHPLKTG